MSHADHRDALLEHVGAAPVRRAMTVGAADDVAEHDADRRADAALGWLASQQPTDQAGAEPHVHTAACGVSRLHDPVGPAGATIGREGGELDPTTQREIEGAVGGGQPLDEPVRATMESAFGAGLGRVRVHRGPQADRISRSISAEAFTTGNDIFFSQGAYDPASARGQRVLAHEIGHVMQNRGGGVRRLFGSKEKKAKAKAAKALKVDAKMVNANNAALAKKVEVSYTTAPGSKLLPPPEFVAAANGLKAWLDKEAEVRTATRAQFVGTATSPAEIDKAVEAAADHAWSDAPPAVRALRPLRYDDFDKALNEVRALAAEQRGDLAGAAAAKLSKNEDDLGAPIDPEKAQKKVLEDRELERRGARAAAAAGSDPAAAAKELQKATAKVDKKVGKENAKAGPEGIGPRQEQALRERTARKAGEEAFGEDDKLEDARKYIKTGSSALGGLGKADKAAGKAAVLGGGAAKDDSGIEINEVVARSTSGLGSVLKVVADLLDFSSHLRDMSQGVADDGAKLLAVQKATTALVDASKATRAILLTTREGVESFGTAGSVVVDQVGTALPIVGLITSALGILDNSLELVPLGERLGSGLTTEKQAQVEGKAPLAASYARVNSRNVQLVEKVTFALAKNSTMLGLHIAELASAGGFGIPMAAKLTVNLTSLAHDLGHAIYDTVGESRSSTAKKNFSVKHLEGASRDVLKYDIGSSVDVIIVAAQKHKLAYARETLIQYGVKETEIDSMWMAELREKVLDGLDAEGDPKTVKEKVTAAKESVAEALGDKKGPAGPKKEKSTLDTVLTVPRAIGGGVSKIPDKIDKQVQAIKDAHADAKALVAAKNQLNYNGRNDRGMNSVTYYRDRDKADNEKSFAKVRAMLADQGVAHDQLPRSAADRKKRAEVEAARTIVSDDAISAPVLLPQGFIAQVVRASEAELETMIDQVKTTGTVDPVDLAKLRFIEMEHAARQATAGGKSKK